MRAAAKEAERVANLRAEVNRASEAPPDNGGRGVPVSQRDERAVGRKAPQVMLGKDGRPLSPLSAALARAKAGFDPEDEEDISSATDVAPCPCCGRNFARDRLQTHINICQKVTLNSQNRKTWDAREQRVDKDRIPVSAMSPARLPASRGASRFSGMHSSTGVGGVSRSVNGAASRSVNGDDYGGGRAGSAARPGSRPAARSSTPGGGGGGGGGDGGMPANKLPKWKRDSLAFKDAMRAGRQLKAAQESGGPLPPPPAPTSQEEDDRVPCPHCGRRFSILAAERHIPKCTSIMAKPKTLTRGGGGQAVATGRGPGGTVGRGRGGFGGGREFEF